MRSWRPSMPSSISRAPGWRIWSAVPALRRDRCCWANQINSSSRFFQGCRKTIACCCRRRCRGPLRRRSQPPVLPPTGRVFMALHLSEARAFLAMALEAQSRYKLRTSLSVLGVVLGVAAVIAMMSVTEGARRDALEQVQLLGLDNLVARNRMLTLDEARGGSSAGLTLADAERLPELVPLSASVSPLVERLATVSQRGRNLMVPLVGIRPSYQGILNLHAGRGRLLSYMDERSGSHVAVL